MLRRMKGLLTALAVILSVGLGSPALASGIFDRDELFFDREDLVEELILRERLFGGAALSPFAISPFGLSPFGLSPFGLSPFGLGAGAFDLLLLEELIDERQERIEDLFEFGVFDLDDFDEFDFDDDDDDD